jgi:iron complex transport system substrate-binding protein
MAIPASHPRLRPVLAAFVLPPILSACRPPPAASQPAGRAPRRIISISPNATEMLDALGEVDRLVAVSTFCVHPPSIAGLPRIGGLFDADVETVLRLTPELVILRGTSRAVERVCAENGIALFRDRTERFEDIEATLHALAGMLGCPERASAVIDSMRRRLDTISHAVRGRPRPRVLLTLGRRPDHLGEIMTASRRTFLHEVIARAGGENIFAGVAMDYPRISPEAVLSAGPDVIVEAMPEALPDAALEARIREQWARIGPIPAVASGRVHLVTDNNALIPSPRIVEVVARLARLLHPGVVID